MAAQAGALRRRRSAMGTLIIFYSRTGTTRSVAIDLANRLDAETLEILCPQYRPGALRYLRAGYDSVRGNLPAIEIPQASLQDYGLLLVGGPVWTSHPALPLRSFLRQATDFPPRIGLFLTYGGHSDSELAFDEMTATLPDRVVARLALNSEDVSSGNYTAALGAFIDTLAEHTKASARRQGRARREPDPHP